MAIPFTDREIQRAWRENFRAYHQKTQTNAHRLLLFYAVECGLKALLMKQRGQRCKRTDFCQEIHDCGHDINKLLDKLGAGVSLTLPHQVLINERIAKSGEINQIWRYGGEITHSYVLNKKTNKQEAQETNDLDIEKKLLEIVSWISPQLGKP